MISFIVGPTSHFSPSLSNHVIEKGKEVKKIKANPHVATSRFELSGQSSFLLCNCDRDRDRIPCLTAHALHNIRRLGAASPAARRAVCSPLHRLQLLDASMQSSNVALELSATDEDDSDDNNNDDEPADASVEMYSGGEVEPSRTMVGLNILMRRAMPSMSSCR